MCAGGKGEDSQRERTSRTASKHLDERPSRGHNLDAEADVVGQPRVNGGIDRFHNSSEFFARRTGPDRADNNQYPCGCFEQRQSPAHAAVALAHSGFGGVSVGSAQPIGQDPHAVAAA